ncbi:hypothetical protein V8F33_005562 [Rhypophila sp. PSN 637]
MSSFNPKKDKLTFGADKSGIHLVRKKSKGKGDKDKGDKDKGKDKDKRKTSASKGIGLSNTLAAAMLHAVGGKGAGEYYLEKVKENQGSRSSGSRRGSSLADSFDRLGIDDDDYHSRSIYRQDSYTSSQRPLLDPPSSGRSYESRDERDYYDDDGYGPRYLDERQPSVHSSGHSSHRQTTSSYQGSSRSSQPSRPAHYTGWNDDDITSTGTSTLYNRTHGVPEPEYEESAARPSPPRPYARDYDSGEDRYYAPSESTQTKSSASTVRPPPRQTSGFRAPESDHSSSKSHGHRDSRSSRHSGNPFSDPKKDTSSLPRGPKAEVIEADDRESLASSKSKATTAAEFTLPPMGNTGSRPSRASSARKHDPPPRDTRHRDTSSSKKQDPPHSSTRHSGTNSSNSKQSREPPHSRSSSKSSRQPPSREAPIPRGPKAEVIEADDRESLVPESTGSTVFETTLPPIPGASRHSGHGTGASRSRHPPPPPSTTSTSSSYYSRGGDPRDRRGAPETGYYPPSESLDSRDHRPPGKGYYPPSSSSTYSVSETSTASGSTASDRPGGKGYYYPPSASTASETSTATDSTAPDYRFSTARKFQVPGYVPGYGDDHEDYLVGPTGVHHKAYIPGSGSSVNSSDSDDTVRGPDRHSGTRASGRREDRRGSRSSHNWY